MKPGNLKRLLIVECLVVAMSSGCIAQTTSPPPALGATPSGPTRATHNLTSPGIVTDFAKLVRQDGPAVVNISTTGVGHTASLTPLWPPAGSEDDPFSQFFRRFSPDHPGVVDIPTQNLSSGFIISPDGYILTDANVITDATRIRVKLTDRREFKATVVGVDSASDVALLKIKAQGLPTVQIGTDSQAKAGQWVVSIGPPYGFENTATAGIISNMTRLLPGETYVPLIQTDMTSNTGDDGSPLFNLNGQVIGLLAPVHSANSNFEGLAFAIPIDAAMKVEQQLEHHVKVEHGRLGVTIQEVTEPLAQSFGMTKPVGALISSVDRSGPSAKSGLRAGDVILQLNGVSITDSMQLPMAVADLRPGSTAHVVFWRDHSTHDTTVVLGTMGDTTLASAAPDQTTAGPDGLTVRGLTSVERHEAGVGGVRVEQSVGPAALAGIQPGDIILMVDNAPVSSATQFRQQVEKVGILSPC